MKRLVIGLVVVLCGVRQAEAAIYFGTSSDPTRIQRVDEDGTNLVTLMDNGSLLPRFRGGIAVDPVANKMYYAAITGSSTGNKLMRSNLDGTDSEVVISGVGALEIQLDLAADQIYFSEHDKISKANLDGSGLETLLSQPILDGFGIDYLAGHIYFGESLSNSIRRSNLDGSDIRTIVQFGDNVDSGDIEIDSSAGKLYWNDWMGSTLQRYDLDGGNPETLVADFRGSHLLLDADNQHIYWSSGSDGIARSNLDGFDRTIILAHNGGIGAMAFGPIVPEPSTLIIWSLLAILGITVGWCRRRRRVAE